MNQEILVRGHADCLLIFEIPEEKKTILLVKQVKVFVEFIHLTTNGDRWLEFSSSSFFVGDCKEPRHRKVGRELRILTLFDFLIFSFILASSFILNISL